MSESINMPRVYLERSLHDIAYQEIPVLPTVPVYRIFVERKKVAARYLNEVLSEIVQEQLLNYIEYCNEQIKKYLAL